MSLTDRIAKQVNIMDNNMDICALGGALSYIDALGNDLGVVRYPVKNGNLLSRSPLFHPTVIIRRRILTDHALMYTEQYRPAEDYFLWLQLSKVGVISAVNDVFVKYRITNNSTLIKDFRRVLTATLKVKTDALFKLNIKPSIKDIITIMVEFALLFFPSNIESKFYFKYVLKVRGKVYL
jgi:hypothetical protein